jgi:hypothetical protein
MEKIGFSAWLKKYFDAPQVKVMYRGKVDGVEYSITTLEERYTRSRSGCSITAPSGKSAVGKNKNGQ